MDKLDQNHRKHCQIFTFSNPQSYPYNFEFGDMVQTRAVDEIRWRSVSLKPARMNGRTDLTDDLSIIGDESTRHSTPH